MRVRAVHAWNVSPKEAMRIQESLRPQVLVRSSFSISDIHKVAGADLAFSSDGQEALAGVLIYSFPELQLLEQQQARVRVRFPYLPGLLAFREGPALLEAFSRVQVEPDVILFDGQGIAHPRGVGIATSMGLFLEKPAVGCAKSRLVGTYEEPGPQQGDWSPLLSGEQVIGAVLRTKEKTQPLFVSIGHLIDLDTALRLTLACCDGYRIPKPTREADAFVEKLKLGEAIPASLQSQTELPL